VTATSEQQAPLGVEISGVLPEGVVLTALSPHADDRGVFTELFRESWPTAVRPIQWNVVSSRAGVLRGVHVHVRHDDYLTVASGRLVLGLSDLRPGYVAATCCLELGTERALAASIPHGVAHGFYYPEPTIHVYAVSHYFDPADELGCRWDDPDLEIPWPQTTAILSSRDRDLPRLAELMPKLQAERAGLARPAAN
jgi:dTDP-4-dehydrorhamnose 3,5-epimerase